MGFSHVDVEISNIADPARRRVLSFVVDTGALMTVVPASILQTLGIPVIGQRRFRGFGGIVQRSIGGAALRYQEDMAAAPVIFGEEGDTPVLGVTALEALGFEVDPVNERLHRVESLMLLEAP